MKKIFIKSDFDSGSIGEYQISDNKINFSLRREGGRVGQWFYFQVFNEENKKPLIFCLENAGESMYPNGWQGYFPVYSIDGAIWKKVDSSQYKNKKFEFIIRQPSENLFVAWYQPYPYEKCQLWLNNVKNSPGVKARGIDKKIEALFFGSPTDASILVIARQHPGETMSSFFIEGFINRLISQDAVSRQLLKKVQIVIIPMPNVDGVVYGNHRYSRRGTDYNRSWGEIDAPSAIKNISELAVNLPKFQLFLDIHGDEASKVNYVYNQKGNMAKKSRKFLSLIKEHSLDFKPLTTLPFWLQKIKKVFFQKTASSTKGTNAVEYMRNKFGILALIYEISAFATDAERSSQMGKELVDAFNDYFSG